MGLMNPERSAKSIELIRDALPAIRRVAILWDPTGNRVQQQSAEAAARSRGLAALTIIGHQAHEIHAAFETARKEGVAAVLVLSSAAFASQRRRIVALAARHRLPTIYERRDFVEAGGLMSYGPDLRDVFRRLAVYADRILKGAKPADLPVEQPTKFELVVNLKTAKALGLTIPPALLLRADQVIE
jgi:putative ABC transport system substrate-binding protein